ncbi:MAG: T9SS type A sorting domain-containing protein, partial [Bradyrhizobiaceae bacterium]|nr:T9SS type A sorting domain-containing protein [Bradyrhizobiaceae bacterium]
LSMQLMDIDRQTMTQIDTNLYGIVSTVTNGHIYGVHGEDTPTAFLIYLHQLDFDWATASAPTGGGATSEVFFPSPCYREGTLSYQVAGEQQVSVRLYDMSGRIVATLAEGLQSGAQHLQVDCQQAPPGAYLLVVQVGASVTTHHILLEGREGGGQ